MKYITLFILCIGNFNFTQAKKSHVNDKKIIAQPNSGLQKDPVVIKMDNKDVKLSQIIPSMIEVIGNNFNSLSKEQFVMALELTKKIYVMERILSQEANKKNYKNRPEFFDKYKKAEDATSIDILMQETGKEFSHRELESAYSTFSRNWNRWDYKFNIILVDDEASAKSIIMGLNNSVAFDAIAKEKSIHRSVNNPTPGLVDFLREDMIMKEFGNIAFNALIKLNPGEVIRSPIKLSNGKFAIFKFVAKRKSALPSLEEVKPSLRIELTNARFEKMLENIIKSGRVKFYKIDGKEQTPDEILNQKKNKA